MLPSIETLISRKARSMGNFTGIFKSRMKHIDSNYKLIEFLSGKNRSTNVVVSVATTEFRFVLI